jgi:hypothetical protein
MNINSRIKIMQSAACPLRVDSDGILQQLITKKNPTNVRAQSSLIFI